MAENLTTIQLDQGTIKALEKQISDFRASQLSGGGIDELSSISPYIGLFEAGEIRFGNGVLPGSGFTGMRLAYPAISTTEGDFHLAGFKNDIVQIGLDADDGTFGWGYSDGIGDNPDPVGFSGIVDVEGIRILYALDPELAFHPGGGASPVGVRSYSIRDSLDPDTSTIISEWGAIHDSGQDITYISFASLGLDTTATSLVDKSISVRTGGAINLDAQLTLSASYITQMTPRLNNVASIIIFADGQNGVTSISLSADKALVNRFELLEIATPSGNPTVDSKWIYTTSLGDLIVEDENGTQTNLLAGGDNTPSLFSRENFPAPGWLYPLDGLDDLSRQANSLTDLGSPGIADQKYLAYSTFSGTNQARFHTDNAEHDISVDSIIFGWLYFTNTASAKEVSISKWDVAGAESTKSYQIYRTAGGVIEAGIRDSGASEYIVTGTTTIASAKWVWVCFRIELGTEISLWIGYDGGILSEEDTNTTSIPASINTGAGILVFGGLANGGSIDNDMDGRIARSGKSNLLWSDAKINTLYNQEKALIF